MPLYDKNARINLHIPINTQINVINCTSVENKVIKMNLYKS